MTKPFVFASKSEADTEAIAQRVADVLTPGLTIALNGELGAGKTRFVRALCRALGGREDQVSSPTFVLMQLYPDARIPIAHFDTWRLGSADEFQLIGAEELLHSPDWLCLVEWAERFEFLLPEDRLECRIRHVSETEREFRILGTGPKSEQIIAHLSKSVGQQN